MDLLHTTSANKRAVYENSSSFFHVFRRQGYFSITTKNTSRRPSLVFFLGFWTETPVQILSALSLWSYFALLTVSKYICITVAVKPIQKYQWYEPAVGIFGKSKEAADTMQERFASSIVHFLKVLLCEH